MSLKQQINNDLDLFLNINHFAELVTVGETDYKVLIDYDGGYEESYVDLIITCKFSEFKDFENGTDVTVNNESYKIHNKSPNLDGLMEVSLAKN